MSSFLCTVNALWCWVSCVGVSCVVTEAMCLKDDGGGWCHSTVGTYVSDTKVGGSVVQEHHSPDTFPVYTGNRSTSQISALQENWRNPYAVLGTCQGLSLWKPAGAFLHVSFSLCTFIEYLYLLSTGLRSLGRKLACFQLQSLVTRETNTSQWTAVSTANCLSCMTTLRSSP